MQYPTSLSGASGSLNSVDHRLFTSDEWYQLETLIQHYTEEITCYPNPQLQLPQQDSEVLQVAASVYHQFAQLQLFALQTGSPLHWEEVFQPLHASTLSKAQRQSLFQVLKDRLHAFFRTRHWPQTSPLVMEDVTLDLQEDTAPYQTKNHSPNGNAYALAVQYLRHLYTQSVKSGLGILKSKFLKAYARSEYQEFYLDMVKQELVRAILQKEEPISSGFLAIPQALTNEWHQVVEEVAVLMKGKPEKLLLENRSPALLKRRETSPPFEPKAYLLFYQWLQAEEYLQAIENPEFLHDPQKYPIKWRSPNSQKEVDLLLKHLVQEDLIDISITMDTFWQHFQSHSDPDPITWKGSGILLMHLFYQLTEKRILPPANMKDIARMIAAHFLNADGIPFKADSMAITYSKGHKMPRDADRLDAFFLGLEEVRKG
ncbi:MAG: hypothetical protein AAGI38_01295 [Bacteroidota bacterium]